MKDNVAIQKERKILEEKIWWSQYVAAGRPLVDQVEAARIEISHGLQNLTPADGDMIARWQEELDALRWAVSDDPILAVGASA